MTKDRYRPATSSALAVLAALSAAVGIFACSFGTALGAAVVNLIPNASFEQGDPEHADRPLGFKPSKFDAVVGQTGAGVIFGWESDPHSGQKSVSVENPTEKDFGSWMVQVPVKSNTSYTLSAYTKCRNETGQPEIVVQPSGGTFRDPGGCDFYLPATTRWNHYIATFTTGASQTRMDVQLYLYGRPSQKVWFDDVSLVETASLPRFDLMTPAAKSIVRDRKPQFNWQPAEGVDRYLLELSRDSFFEGEVHRASDLTANAWQPQRFLEPGTYFWRLGIRDDQGLPHFSPTSNFLIPGPGTPFVHRDTTPPAISQLSPPPDSTVESGTTVVSAAFDDAGSGVDVKSAKVFLDNRDVTGKAEITEGGLTVRPSLPLPKGIHQVEVAVRDTAGNKANRAVWRFGVGVRVPVVARFDQTPTFRVNNEPYFPIGLYSYCCNPFTGVFSESLMRRAAVAGFNGQLVEDTGSEAALDTFLRNGMKVMLQVRGSIEKGADAASMEESLVTKGAVRWKDHPALLGYWADEPDSFPEEKLSLGQRTIHAHDPNHPAVWCLCVPSKYEQNARTADAIMPDIYPVPASPIRIIYSQLKKAAKDAAGKQVWFIPQAFDWVITSGGKLKSPADFRPTPAELRAMTYLGIVAGAKAIFYWASDTANSNDIVWYAAQWNEALKIAGELRYLSPLLAAGKPVDTVRLTSASPALRFLALQRGDRDYVIAVNTEDAPAQATFQLASLSKVRCLFQDRETLKPVRECTDLFKPYGVAVYELG